MNTAQNKVAALTKEAYVKYHVPILASLMNDVLDKCLKETMSVMESLQPKATLFKDVFPTVVGGMAYNSIMHESGLIEQALETKDIDLKFFLSSKSYKKNLVNTNTNSKRYIKEVDVHQWLDEVKNTTDVKPMFNKMIENLSLPPVNSARRQMDVEYHNTVINVMSARLLRHVFIRKVKDAIHALLSNVKGELDGFRVSIESWYPKKMCNVSSIDGPELVSICCAYIYKGYQFQFACLDTSFVSPTDCNTSYWYDMYFKYLEGLGSEQIDTDVALSARFIPMAAQKFSDSNFLFVANMHYLLMDTMKMLKKGEHANTNPGYTYMDYLYMDTYKCTSYLRKYMDLTSAMGRKFFGHRILESNYFMKTDVDALIPMFDAKLKVLERENMLRSSDLAIENARKEYIRIILELHKVFKRHAFSNGWDELKTMYDAIPTHPMIPVQRTTDFLNAGDDEENVIVVDGEPIIFGKKTNGNATGGGSGVIELDSMMHVGIVSILNKKEFLQNVHMSNDGFFYNLPTMNRVLLRLLQTFKTWDPMGLKPRETSTKLAMDMIKKTNTTKMQMSMKQAATAAGGASIKKRRTKKQ